MRAKAELFDYTEISENWNIYEKIINSIGNDLALFRLNIIVSSEDGYSISPIDRDDTFHEFLEIISNAGIRCISWIEGYDRFVFAVRTRGEAAVIKMLLANE